MAALLLWAPMAGASTALSGHYANVGDHRLYYEIRDPTNAAGPPVVLLHGGGSNIQTSFADQIDFLAHRHRVIAVEQRGHGHSGDVAGPLTYAGMATDTAALMRELGVRRANFVGFSDGAIIALMLAIRHPDLVRRVVSSGANLDPQGLTAQSYAQTQAARPPDLFGPAERADYAAASPDGIGHLEIFGGKLRELWLQHPTPDEISVAMLRTIQCPVLVVAGDHDEIKLEHTLLIYRSIPHSRLWILPQTGHATFALRPEWMNPMIESFLSEP